MGFAFTTVPTHTHEKQRSIKLQTGVVWQTRQGCKFGKVCICSYKVTYVFRSQSHSDVVVRVDCSNSKNCLSHRGDLDYTIKLEANSTGVNRIMSTLVIIIKSILSLLILSIVFVISRFSRY